MLVAAHNVVLKKKMVSGILKRQLAQSSVLDRHTIHHSVLCVCVCVCVCVCSVNTDTVETSTRTHSLSLSLSCARALSLQSNGVEPGILIQIVHFCCLCRFVKNPVCVCVCVCVRARARVFVGACMGAFFGPWLSKLCVGVKPYAALARKGMCV